MTLTTAGFAVAGIAATTIPILIHLLWRRRKRPVPWAAMRFLEAAWRRQRRRLRIEQWLLLAARCLALLLLGFALARPILESGALGDLGGGRVVHLVIDDGLVSGLADPGGAAALDRHVAAALAVLDELEPSDRVSVITASRPARGLVVPPSGDHRAIATLLRSLAPSSARSDLGGAMDRLRIALEQDREAGEPSVAYLFSDFRAGSARLDDPLPALAVSGEGLILRATPPATEARTNATVVAIEPMRHVVLPGASDGSDRVTVRLRRESPDLPEATTRVALAGSGIARVAPRDVAWRAGQVDAAVDFALELGTPRDVEAGLEARIDEDALSADDRRGAVIAVRRRIRVALLDRRAFGAASIDRLTAGQWIRRALEPVPDGPIELVEVEPASVQPADLRAADAVVLARPDLVTEPGWSALREFAETGGVVVIAPPADDLVHQWTDAAREALGIGWSFGREVRVSAEPVGLAAEQPPSTLLALLGSDLAELVRPVVVERLLLVDPGDRGETILRLDDGAPLVVTGRPEREGAAAPGLVVMLAAAPRLDWTNLPGKPLMVPLLQEIIRQGASLVRRARPAEVGDRPVLASWRAASRLVAPDGSTIALDRERRPVDPLTRPGLHRVLDAAGTEIGVLAVNVDPDAARTAPAASSAVELWLGRSGAWAFFDPADPAAPMRRGESGAPIAGLLLAALLVALLAETFLGRRFSRAERAGRGGEDRGLLPTMSERTGGVA